MSLEEYKEMLEQHDWYYMMSDDHRVYRAGKDAEYNLKQEARKGGDEFKRAYNKAYSDRFHAPPYNVPHVWPFPEVVK